jgi:ADP-ribosylglycohydrolase
MKKVVAGRPLLIGRLLCLVVIAFHLAGCARPVHRRDAPFELIAEVYFDRVYGAWKAMMVANHTGLGYEGEFLDSPGPMESIDLELLEEWSTDDDTAVEWVDLHIMETHGIDPTYEQIRDEWLAHLNNDIWVSTRRARDLMDQGVVPPDTGSAALNPDGVWSIDAQLQTELFGLIAPGMPDQAARRARYFARVTNSGLAVEVSAFYAAAYALAFVHQEVEPTLIRAEEAVGKGSEVSEILGQVRKWYLANPDDWRLTRANIHQAYDDDPAWWSSRVNFASTIMALFYGEGDLIETMTIASLAGWDADNNATTAAGLLGVLHGYQRLPPEIQSATEFYYNEDVTGGLPQYDTVVNIARRTQRIALEVVLAAGGKIENGVYLIGVE